MPRLLRIDGEIEAPPPLKDLASWTPDCGAGLKLAVDDEIAEEMLSAAQIAIDFPAFSDGRGLSLAVLLRTRHGYQGDLIAVGAVHGDLLHYMKRCGFSGFVLGEEQEIPSPETRNPYSEYYQASATEPLPAFRRTGISD